MLSGARIRDGVPYAGSGADPILHDDSWHTLIMTPIARDHSGTLRQSNGCNKQVRICQLLPSSFQSSLDLAKGPARGCVHVYERQRLEKGCDQFAMMVWPSRLRRPIVELRCRDPGGRNLVVNRRAPVDHCLISAQNLDAGIGVQELHSSTLRPEVRAA